MIITIVEENERPYLRITCNGKTFLVELINETYEFLNHYSKIRCHAWYLQAKRQYNIIRLVK